MSQFRPKIGHFWGKSWHQKWPKNGLGRTKSDSFSISHKNSWNYLSFKPNYMVEVGGNQCFPVYWKLAIFYVFDSKIEIFLIHVNFLKKITCVESILNMQSKSIKNSQFSVDWEILIPTYFHHVIGLKWKIISWIFMGNWKTVRLGPT